jgi:RNA polymerase sigma-70 factor (ECF subfamily)
LHDTQTEHDLIKRAGRGDADAFEQLLSAQENRIYAISLRMCGSHEEAQDCTQEAMIRIWRALSTFKGQSSFSTWVYRVTMNTCLDELRRRKSRSAVSLEAMVDNGFAPADESDTPERSAVRREQRYLLEKAIYDLPEDMKSAIVLRDIQGLSYEEIATVLDTNVGTIKSRISRGREKLRSVLSHDPELFGRHTV